MEIYFCPECEGKPYTESTKAGTKCPVCKARLQFAEVSEASLAGRPKLVARERKRLQKRVRES